MTNTTLDGIHRQAYIDGQFTDASDAATFETLNPATGKAIANIAACGPADVDRAVASARTAFESGAWSTADPNVRKNTLLRFADLIEKNVAELAELETLDAGKPITDCRDFDLPDVINTLRWYAEAIDKVFGKTSPTGSGHLGMIVREPIGVVGAVLPWNFPAAMLMWKLAPALAAGNSVVVKPPELASLTTLRIAELATQAGLPDGVFNVIPGLGHVAGKALGLHHDVDMITFTGSTEIGREFLRYSANSNLKNIVLECGGKNPPATATASTRSLLTWPIRRSGMQARTVRRGHGSWCTNPSRSPLSLPWPAKPRRAKSVTRLWTPPSSGR
jgi:gamma-glutamyl-gamma-aminobutyraldehyde dehydrogenase